MSPADHFPGAVAVIPCLNEDRFIGDIVSRAAKYVDEVIVVDDGSTDRTAQAAIQAGAVVISHPTRQGAGSATRTGLKAAIKDGARVVVTLDGDNQHNPDEIPLLLQPCIEDKADMVIGSRFMREACVPAYRKFGIDVITWMYNAGHKNQILDAQSGFRAYGKKALEAINITYPGFGFSIQTLVQARKQGLKIVEVSISCIYHDVGSTINPVIHGLSVAWSVLKIRMKEEFFKGGGSSK